MLNKNFYWDRQELVCSLVNKINGRIAWAAENLVISQQSSIILDGGSISFPVFVGLLALVAHEEFAVGLQKSDND